MFRLSAIAVLAVTLPGLGFAADKATDCAATAAIVADAVDERTGGNSQQETIAFLTSDKGGIEEKYVAAVPMLVEWVYTLEQDQLTDAAPESFKKACLAHN